ncbi:MAG: hypothetical protein ACNFW9_06105 [Candidatus Kerfeldbacteria bacterium]
MTPVDGIGPPKSKKRKPTYIENKGESIPEKKSTEIRKPSYQTNDEHKHRLVWFISIGIVVLLFIGWLSIFQGSELSSSNDDSFLTRISNNFDTIWESLKEDILKINTETKTETSNINEAEQQLKDLEEKVFPEFIESN